MKPPCKDCKSRKCGCHASCTAYQKYRQDMDQILDRKAEKSHAEDDYYTVRGTGIHRRFRR